MPFVFLVAAIILIVAAVRGQASNMASLLKGESGFVSWALALIILGALGYIKPIKPVVHAFTVLVIVVLLLSNKGFFSQFNAAIKAPAPTSTPTTPTAPAAPIVPTAPSVPTSSSSAYNQTPVGTY